MLSLRPAPREEMASRWRSSNERRKPKQAPPRPLNLDVVLDLGNVIFFTFRGRAYGIPPLGWREGEALLDAWLEARSYGDQLERDQIKPYYACLARIQKLLWRNTRCVGRIRRVFRRLGLMRNPYRTATEGELGQLATFFLARRTTSSVRPANPSR